jgi:tetratricopeptide (TPR) repeat protein
MYSVAIAVAIGLLFGLGGWLLAWWSLFWVFVFTPIVMVVAWVVLVRLIGKRVMPMNIVVQRQMEAGHVDAAMQSLRDMLRFANWMPLLRGQVMAQLGILNFHLGKHDEAEKLLLQSTRRAPEGQVILAVLHYRAGQKDRAFQTLQLAGVVNRGNSYLHNVRAWLLHKDGRVDEAIAALGSYLKKQAIDEQAKENLLRLQNGKKPTMKSFGMPWYVLGFEQPPPEMGQLRTHRKGFRTPPMRRGN